MRLLITLQYLGTRYAGWQTQVNALGIQQIFERALTELYGTALRVEAAGRTDSGVHARGQRVHTDVPFAIEPRGFVLGSNTRLPADIRVLDVATVEDDFHCRFRAKAKTYVYQIWNAPVADVFALETHAHVPQHLDHEVMNAAAQILAGTHDFSAFTVAEPEVSSTTRTITNIAVERIGNRVTITVTADGFLRFMVRRIAGSLIELGRGRDVAIASSLEPEFVRARWAAPARGLVLEKIDYA